MTTTTKSNHYTVATEADMLSLGASLAAIVHAPRLVFFRGSLGVGKTTLIRGFLREKGITGTIKSPSFSVVETYQENDTLFHHFDLYRIQEPEELELLGIRDYLQSNAIVLVEWPELGKGLLPEPDLIVEITASENSRIVDVWN